jgi:hypothetical protein
MSATLMASLRWARAINNKPIPGWLMQFRVRHGLGSMPGFSERGISERELDELVAYILALRRLPRELMARFDMSCRSRS